MISYFSVAVIYWILISRQIVYMIKNQELPSVYVRFYTNEEIKKFNKIMNEFRKTATENDKSLIETSLNVATWLVLLISSIFWPVMLTIDIFSIFKKNS